MNPSGDLKNSMHRIPRPLWLGGEMVYIEGAAVEAVEKLARKIEKSSNRRAV
jgi:hypothetical protein